MLEVVALRRLEHTLNDLISISVRRFAERVRDAPHDKGLSTMVSEIRDQIMIQGMNRQSEV